MKKSLKRAENNLWHVDGQRVIGANPNMSGVCSRLRGNIDECELSASDRQRGIAVATLEGPVGAEDGPTRADFRAAKSIIVAADKKKNLTDNQKSALSAIGKWKIYGALTAPQREQIVNIAKDLS